MNCLPNLIHDFLFFPTIFLQPSYIDPAAVIVVAFYQLIWWSFLGLLLLGFLFQISKEKTA